MCPLVLALYGWMAVLFQPLQGEQVPALGIVAVYGVLMAHASIAVQLVLQFSAPCSRLLPGFARPHFVVAGVLWMLFTMATVLLMTRMGAAPLGTMAFIAAPTGVLALASVAVSALQTRIGVALRGLEVLLLLVVMFAAAFRRDEIIHFLEAPVPWLAAAVLAGTAASCAAAGRRLMRLHQDLAEFGLDHNGLFPNRKLQARRLARIERAASRGSFALGLFSLQERRLEAVLRAPSAAGPVARWRVAASTPISALMLVLAIGPWIVASVVLIVLCLVGFAEQMLARVGTAPRLGFAEFVPLTSVIGCGLSVGTSVMMGGAALSRRGLLAQELLRPVTRDEFRRTLCLGLLADLWPCCVAALIWGGLAWAINAGPRLGVPAIDTHLILLMLAILAMTAGMTLWLMSVGASQWQAMMVLYLLSIPLMFIEGALFGRLGPEEQAWRWASVGVLAAAAAIAAVAGWHRFSRTEWGRLRG
ncbi:MAG: hypothetical protein KF774_18465 [Planctomyces sp.]|nr:hypothetical protein [Planctomyces sp.]